MYHHHSQQEGPPQPFSNRPGPFHHQEQAHQHQHQQQQQQQHQQQPQPQPQPQQHQQQQQQHQQQQQQHQQQQQQHQQQQHQQQQHQQQQQQQQQQHSHFQYPPIIGSRDMDMAPMDMDTHMDLDRMNGSGSGGYSSAPQPLSESQRGRQQELDWSNYHHPAGQMFSSSSSTVTQQPQSSHSAVGMQAWAHAPAYEPPSPQTRGSHSRGVDVRSLRTIPESAGSILASFGLSKQDLEVLSQYPDDQLTPDKLPYILQDMLSRKSNDHGIAASSSSYSQSATRVSRETLPPPSCSQRNPGRWQSPEGSSLRSAAQTAGKCIDYGHSGKCIDYGHSSLASDVSSSREAFIREPLSSERKMVSRCPPASSLPKQEMDMPERWQPAERNQHRDLDYRRSSGEVHKSQWSPAAEFPLPPTSHRPAIDYRRDGPRRSPSSETRSDYSSSSRRPASLASLSKARDGSKRLPTPSMISDFSAEPPKVYPHTCTLCLIDCEQAKDWFEHVKSAKHTDSCRDLRNKYPEWKPNVPRKEPQSLRQDDSRTTKERSPSRPVSAKRERTERERERLKREDRGRGMDPRPSKIHSPNRSHRGSSSSSSHRPEKRASHSPEGRGRGKDPRPSKIHSPNRSHRGSSSSSSHRPEKRASHSPGRSSRDSLKRPRDKSATRGDDSARRKPPSSTKSAIKTKPKPGSNITKPGSAKADETKTVAVERIHVPAGSTAPTALTEGRHPPVAIDLRGEPATHQSAKGPPAKKVSTPSSQLTKAASHPVHLTGIPTTVTGEKVTDLVGGYDKINSVVLLPGKEAVEEEEEQKKPGADDSAAVSKGTSSQELSAIGGEDSGNRPKIHRKTPEEKLNPVVLMTRLTESDVIKRCQPFGAPTDIILATQLGKGELEEDQFQDFPDLLDFVTVDEVGYTKEKEKERGGDSGRERREREARERRKRHREDSPGSGSKKGSKRNSRWDCSDEAKAGPSGPQGDKSVVKAQEKKEDPAKHLQTKEERHRQEGKGSEARREKDARERREREAKEKVKRDRERERKVKEGSSGSRSEGSKGSSKRDGPGGPPASDRAKKESPHDDKDSHTVPTTDEEDSILKEYGKSDCLEMSYSNGAVIGYHCKLCDYRVKTTCAVQIDDHFNGKNHNILLIQTKSLRSLYLAKKRDDLEDICRNESIVMVNKHPSPRFHCKLCKHDCTDVYHHLKGKWHIASLWAKQKKDKLSDETRKKTSIKVGEDVKTDRTKVGLAEQPEESKTIDKINSGPKESKSSSSAAGDGEASSSKPADLELPKESPRDPEDSIPQGRGNSVYLEEVCFDDGTILGFRCKVCKCSFLTDTKDAHLKGRVHKENEIEANLNKYVVEVNNPKYELRDWTDEKVIYVDDAAGKEPSKDQQDVKVGEELSNAVPTQVCNPEADVKSLAIQPEESKTLNTPPEELDKINSGPMESKSSSSAAITQENETSVPREKKASVKMDNRNQEADAKFCGEDEYVEEIPNRTNRNSKVILLHCKLCKSIFTNDNAFAKEQHLKGQTHLQLLAEKSKTFEEVRTPNGKVTFLRCKVCCIYMDVNAKDQHLKTERHTAAAGDGEPPKVESEEDIVMEVGDEVGDFPSSPLPDAVAMDTTVMVDKESPANDRDSHTVPTADKEDSAALLSGEDEYIEEIPNRTNRNSNIILLHCKLCKSIFTNDNAFAKEQHLKGQTHAVSLQLLAEKSKTEECFEEVRRTPNGRVMFLRCKFCKCCIAVNAKDQHLKTERHTRTLEIAKRPDEGKPVSTPPEELDKINSGPKETTSSRSAAADGEPASSKPADLDLPKDSHTVPPADKKDSTPQANAKSVPGMKKKIRGKDLKVDDSSVQFSTFVDRNVDGDANISDEYIEDVRNSYGKYIFSRCKLCDCSFANSSFDKLEHLNGTGHAVKLQLRGEKRKAEVSEKISGEDEYVEVRDPSGKVILFLCKVCERSMKPHEKNRHPNTEAHKHILKLRGCSDAKKPKEGEPRHGTDEKTSSKDEAAGKELRKDLQDIEVGKIKGKKKAALAKQAEESKTISTSPEGLDKINSRPKETTSSSSAAGDGEDSSNKPADLELPKESPDDNGDDAYVERVRCPIGKVIHFYCNLCKCRVNLTAKGPHLNTDKHRRLKLRRKLKEGEPRHETGEKVSSKDEAAGKEPGKDQQDVKVGEELSNAAPTQVCNPEADMKSLAIQPEESKTINTPPEELDQINSGPMESKSSSSAAGDGEVSSSKPAHPEPPKESPDNDRDSHTVPTADKEDSITQEAAEGLDKINSGPKKAKSPSSAAGDGEASSNKPHDLDLPPAESEEDRFQDFPFDTTDSVTVEDGDKPDLPGPPPPPAPPAAVSTDTSEVVEEEEESTGAPPEAEATPVPEDTPQASPGPVALATAAPEKSEETRPQTLDPDIAAEQHPHSPAPQAMCSSEQPDTPTPLPAAEDSLPASAPATTASSPEGPTTTTTTTSTPDVEACSSAVMPTAGGEQENPGPVSHSQAEEEEEEEEETETVEQAEDDEDKEKTAASVSAKRLMSEDQRREEEPVQKKQKTQAAPSDSPLPLDPDSADEHSLPASAPATTASSPEGATSTPDVEACSSAVMPTAGGEQENPGTVSPGQAEEEEEEVTETVEQAEDDEDKEKTDASVSAKRLMSEDQRREEEPMQKKQKTQAATPSDSPLPLDPDSADAPAGMEFLVPRTGFFCQVCNNFFSGGQESELNHCKSLEHNHNLQKYLKNRKTTSS